VFPKVYPKLGFLNLPQFKNNSADNVVLCRCRFTKVWKSFIYNYVFYYRGTRFLHRWQTDNGSRWYSGKILRKIELKKGKYEFEVEYIDDDNDGGPLLINLYEDYPHDIRIVTR